MTNEEAIARIRDHKIVHKMNEPRAIYISEALDMAIKALGLERKTGKWFLLDECSNEGWYCDQCHKKVFKKDFSNTMRKYKFCPNCGSRMEWPVPYKAESEDKA